MKIRPVWVTLMISVLFLAAFLASCAEPKSQSAGGPSQMVMTACSACHPTQKVCDALGKKDKDAWNATVTRMVGKGAKVEKSRIPDVVDYLAGLQPGSAPVCGK